VDPTTRRFRRPVLAVAQRRDGTQAGSATASADLVRCSHPNALACAVRFAHGFIGAGSSTTAAFAQHARIAQEQLHQQRRDPGCFTLAKRVYIAIDNDADKARDRITDALERRYGYFGMTNLAAVPVAGTVDDCVAGLHEVAVAGAQLILLNPLVDELHQMHRLATEVIPRLAQPALNLGMRWFESSSSSSAGTTNRRLLRARPTASSRSEHPLMPLSLCRAGCRRASRSTAA
jgi:hypothetical protein